MSKQTNTCVIYEKLRQSYEKLSNLLLEKDKLISNIDSEYEEMASISGNHDDFLKNIITKFDDVEKNLNEQFTNIENINNTINSALDSFSQSEEGLQVDKEKFNSFIQNNSLIDDEVKEQLKSSTLAFYYTAEAFNGSLSDSEKKLLEEYKAKLEEYTKANTSSNVITDQEFDDGPVEENQGQEEQVESSSSTSSNRTVYYRKTAAVTSGSVISASTVEKATKSTSKEDSVQENKKSNEETTKQEVASTDKEQTTATDQPAKKDNQQEQTQKEEIKTNIEEDSKQSSFQEEEKVQQQQQTSTPIASEKTTPEINNSKSTTLSQVAKNLTTSLTGSKETEVLDSQELEDISLETDEAPYFPTMSSNSNTSALDDMLTYTDTSSEVDTESTKSSGIAPVAIGLGLAGTTSVAANRIIRKKEKKQLDRINEFDGEKSNEERRFIPKDLPETEEGDSSPEENSSSNNQSEENDWYKYIKELY